MPQSDILVLTDDRAGNVSQAIGVANALGVPYRTHPVFYNKWVRLSNIVRGASLKGVDLEKTKPFEDPWPKVVIAVGRRLAPVARYIKKMSKGQTKLVQIMWPGNPASDFDMVVVPEHDKISPSKHVVKTVGAPNWVNPKILESEANKWQQQFSYLPEPKVAMLIGGSTKKYEFTRTHGIQLARKANHLLMGDGGSFLVSTSRRTDLDVVKALKQELQYNYFFYDYTRHDENPYRGILAVCDAIIVTGDSVSMCSEACSTGKPVYIFAPPEITAKKMQHFHKSLYQSNYAKPLDGKLTDFSYTPLAEAHKIAKLVKERFL